MFEQHNTKAYVKQAKFMPGKDESNLVTFTFFLTPIDYNLAVEIDPHIADRLFRKVGPDWNPCQEFDKVPFKITPESCSMKFKLHEELESGGGYIPLVEFSSLRAFKPFSNDPNFSLAFDATFPAVDKDTIWQLLSRLKKTVLITFDKVQPELPFAANEAAPKCEECENPPRYKTADGQRFFCTEHVRAAGDEQVVELPMDERMKLAKDAADASMEEQPEAEENPNNSFVKRRRERKAKKKATGK